MDLGVPPCTETPIYIYMDGSSNLLDSGAWGRTAQEHPLEPTCDRGHWFLSWFHSREKRTVGFHVVFVESKGAGLEIPWEPVATLQTSKFTDFKHDMWSLQGGGMCVDTQIWITCEIRTNNTQLLGRYFEKSQRTNNATTQNNVLNKWR